MRIKLGALNFAFCTCAMSKVTLGTTNVSIEFIRSLNLTFDFGYKVKVIHDACATLDLAFNGIKVPAAHAHATLMAAFEFAYAQVISTEDYISSFI